MGLAVVGIVVGWIAGEAGTTTVGGVMTLGSLIALGGLTAAFAAKRRRATRWTTYPKT